MSLKTNHAGCALCDSTWGNVHDTVEGTPLFFCCSICALQFRNLITRVREATGWPQLDEVEIAGDRRGRTVVAGFGGERNRFWFAFNAEGELREFRPLPSTSGSRPG